MFKRILIAFISLSLISLNCHAQMLGLALTPSGQPPMTLIRQLKSVAPGSMTFGKSYQLNQASLNADYSVGSGTATFTAARTGSAPATYVNGSGVIQKTTTANVPRYQGGYYDSNGFHAQTGLMIENVGTNLLTDTDGTLNGSGIWTNWSAATGGSGTITKSNNDATGLLNISNSKTQRIQYTGQSGDSSTYVYLAGPITGTGTIAQNNVVTVSCWAKSQTGGIPVELWIVSRNSGGSSLTTYSSSAITLTTSWRRYQFTATITDATVSEASFRIGPNAGVNNGSNVDYEIVAPQMEINTYATSFIPTTTTSLTRPIDNLKYVISGNRTANQETIFIKFAPESVFANDSVSRVLLDNDTKARTIKKLGGGTAVSSYGNATDSSAVVQAAITIPQANASYVSTSAVQYNTSPYINVYTNEISEGKYTGGGFTSPAWGTYFYIGESNATTTPINGIIQAVYFYKSILSSNAIASVVGLIEDYSPSVGLYVNGSTGNDSNPGTLASPFATISKCASVAVAGTICNISAGTYREQVTVATSGTPGAPIVFNGAGQGQTIVDGSNLVTGWSVSSGSIYSAAAGTLTSPNQVYVDGTFLDVTHYPANGSYLTTTSTGTTTTIVDSGLGTPGTIIGSTVTAKLVQWALSSEAVTGYNSGTGTITVGSPLYYASVMPSGWGFYLSNMQWMQTYAGSWWYDSTGHNLYLWTSNSSSPSGHTVEISARSYGFYINNQSYITIKNMTVSNAITDNIYANNGIGININNITSTGGLNGVYLYTATDDIVQNSTISGSLNDGIVGQNLVSSDISNNTVSNIANFGVPKSSDASIFITGTSTNNYIESNSVSYSSYNGIGFLMSGGGVDNNTVNQSCLVLDDCGGIYSNQNTGTIYISNNTVNNSIGNITGTNNSNTFAIGIYLDDLANGYTISNNTVTNSDVGIFLHSAYNNTVTYNKTYASRQYGFLIAENGDGSGVTVNNAVNHNQFEGLAQIPSLYGSGAISFLEAYNPGTDPSTWGTYDYNTYCSPNSLYAVSKNMASSGITNYLLPAWQSFASQDAHSTFVNGYCP